MNLVFIRIMLQQSVNSRDELLFIGSDSVLLSIPHILLSLQLDNDFHCEHNFLPKILLYAFI